MIPPETLEIIDYQEIRDEDYRQRLSQFKTKFELRTREDLHYIIKAPGRVNLIGDHIDYHGFKVLPMTIEKSIWLGCSFRARKDCSGVGWIGIYNENIEIFPDFIGEHSLSHFHSLDQSPNWENYILCGYHGVLTNILSNVDSSEIFEYTKSRLSSGDAYHENKISQLPDTKIFIDSDLPLASGLSSSSALVCASAVATHLMLISSGLTVERPLSVNQIARDCSNYEHLVGTQGGGMDQAVIMTAHCGYAKQVEFSPTFQCHDVQLPNDLELLVAHCGSEYPKAATTGYNTRVMETKLGAALIVKYMSNNGSNNLTKLDKSITLIQVKQNFFASMSTDEIVRLLKNKIFVKDQICLEEVSEILEMTIDELSEKFAIPLAFLRENRSRSFPLRMRCEHVFEEADRVQVFINYCKSNVRDQHQALGDLMNQSHSSLRDKYECSHKDLDKLVDLACESGALGARLTGAGWGGCIVALVEPKCVQKVESRLQKVSRFVIRTRPQAGCSIVKFSSRRGD